MPIGGRYGFNGKEQDNDIDGTGVDYDYGFRIYDARIGKFLSVDPLTSKYPDLSPFAYAENSPIKFIDIDGLEVGTAATPAPPVPEIDIPDDDEILSRYSRDLNGNLIITPPPPSPGTAAAVGPTVMGVYTNPVWIDSYGNDYVPSIAQRVNYLKNKLAQAKSLQYAIHHPSPQVQAARINESLRKNAAVLPSTGSFSSNYNQRITTDPSNLSDDELKGVKQRILNNTATSQDYLYAKEVYKRNSKASVGQNAAAAADGVIYLRIDENGIEKPYVGQAKNWDRYQARQQEHSNKNKKSKFKFYVLDRGVEGSDLDKKEQDGINTFGGPTNNSNPNGGLSNKMDKIKQQK